MPSASFSGQQITSTRDAIGNSLGLQLSDDEVETLLSGGALPFQELTESRNLSEIGAALIRADALNRAERECGKGCFRLATPLGDFTCVCLKKPILELSIHSHKLEE